MYLCIYCDHNKLYTLANGHKKCAKCRRKFSVKKIEMQEKLLEAFCDKKPISHFAQEENISYEKIYNFFNKLRLQIAYKSESDFLNNLDRVDEYEEFIYIPNYKKSDPNALYESKNILVFDYGGKIHTSLLRVENSYTPQNIDLITLKKIFTHQKIAKLKYRDNKIVKFIDFFELEMKRFKGVSDEKFFYYLKECEFLFNYQVDERKDLLKTFSRSL